MNILQISSSIRGDASHSNRLAQLIVDRLQAKYPDAQLKLRDVGRTPHPELDENALQALLVPAEQRSAEQTRRVALDDELIAEIQAADLIVLGVPMYNFSIPVQLKNWLDAIARVRVTFRYTETGPEGLLQGKKVYAVLTRGGVYRDSPADVLAPYLQTVLGFLGMTDVEFVYAEGLALGPAAEQEAFRDAENQISALLA
ncbi:MAG: NAD(P)H-dependent oxidoreductase [Methylococcus sp.]|nr:NAD(P)H-dependent oxidoreductase [Methylococcus sp.]